MTIQKVIKRIDTRGLNATPKQIKLTDAVQRFRDEHDDCCSPTYRELADLLGKKSVAAVHQLAMSAVDAGLMTYTPGKSRSLLPVVAEDEG